jgi:sec-independent protein translocase protein TatA
MTPIIAFGFSPMDAILILVVILLLFGGKKLPELANALGRSLNEFKKGKDDGSKAPAEDEKLEEKKPEASEKK